MGCGRRVNKIKHFAYLSQDAMEFLGLLGIIVNCMLIGQSGQVHRMFPDMTRTQTVLLIIVLEVRKLLLSQLISSLSLVVQNAYETEFSVEFICDNTSDYLM